jgi:hypothetical protein
VAGVPIEPACEAAEVTAEVTAVVTAVVTGGTTGAGKAAACACCERITRMKNIPAAATAPSIARRARRRTSGSGMKAPPRHNPPDLPRLPTIVRLNHEVPDIA